jgi:hypothetical protein
VCGAPVGAGSIVAVLVVVTTCGVDELTRGDGEAVRVGLAVAPGRTEVEALGRAEVEAPGRAEVEAPGRAEPEARGVGLAFGPPGPVPTQAASSRATGSSTTKPAATRLVRAGGIVPDIDSPLTTG